MVLGGWEGVRGRYCSLPEGLGLHVQLRSSSVRVSCLHKPDKQSSLHRFKASLQ